MIRVGRREYRKDGSYNDPSFPGFTSILVLTKSSEYGSLGPYCLKDEQGRIMECLYQASKVYEYVPATIQRYSRYDNRIIWNHPAEQHIRDGNSYLHISHGEKKVTGESISCKIYSWIWQ